MSPCVKPSTAPQTLAGQFADEESGQDLIEYALIAAFAGFVAISGIRSLALDISNSVNTVTSEMAAAVTPATSITPPTAPAPAPVTTTTPTSPPSTHHDRH